MVSEGVFVTVVLAALLTLSAALKSTELNIENDQHWNLLKAKTPLTWPALRFHFSIKRSSLSVHGQDTFDMYANPILLEDNNHVLYDVYATFMVNNILHNYTLVNGIAYFERTRFATSNSSSSPTPVVMCSDAEFGKLPAINSIVTAVNQATAVPHDSHSDCSTGSSYKTAISGVGYEVCVSGTSGFMMRSNELDVTVEYLEVHINIQAPTTDSPDHKCVKSYFLNRAAVLQKYREFLRITRPLAADARLDIRCQIRSGFDAYRFEEDEQRVKLLLLQAREQMKMVLDLVDMSVAQQRSTGSEQDWKNGKWAASKRAAAAKTDTKDASDVPSGDTDRKEDVKGRVGTGWPWEISQGTQKLDLQGIKRR
ncbi:hypothetical protein PsorP6_012370 [Peronosclerospora sorghi]|uniref:Uncharacterized protein n=1 Tax=Peronosclerospora sorghi TaxID=230839 RepID=A0ACC0WGN0_9STRA|nr:hypothetical protein PsorP6_012370 [Peronosclerospora sorghi]